MFKSFFPDPKPFFLSSLLWTAIVMAGWYAGLRDLGSAVGWGPLGPGAQPPVGASVFWSGPFLWFYVYFAAAVFAFAAAWRARAPHPWSRWSVLGTALILFVTYFQVQVSVAINRWYGPFYDIIQAALAKSRPVTLGEFYGSLASFLGIAMIAVTVAVLLKFFVSHYIFRWRTAMNDYYMARWERLRSQRAM